MEAFSNALHAVNLRCGDDAPSEGRIQITILRDSSEVIGFKIEDNGIGFTDENYRSFRTPDSCQKIGLGGKGVGRLSWLRVFGGAKIESIYAEGDQFLRRSFDFVLDKSNQLRNDLNGAANGAIAPRTVITLGKFKSKYNSRCPSKPETLVQRPIAHFLPILASGACPSAQPTRRPVTLSQFRQPFDEPLLAGMPVAYRPQATDEILARALFLGDRP